MEIRKAKRQKAKLRLGIASPSGGGKTMSALLMAQGLGGKIGMIDTENGSGDLYSDICDYDICQIQKPFTVAKYISAIKEFERLGYSTIIIDSLSHAWAGEGGILDKHGKASAGKNSFAAWRDLTPEHNSLVETMLESPCHIIATMRSKQDYIMETNEKGKIEPKKIGLAPVQREGMEYEFTVFMDIDINHIAHASKDRTGIFDGLYFKIEPKTGTQILNWLESGTTEKSKIISEIKSTVPDIVPVQKEIVDTVISESNVPDGCMMLSVSKKYVNKTNVVYETPDGIKVGCRDKDTILMIDNITKNGTPVIVKIQKNGEYTNITGIA